MNTRHIRAFTLIEMMVVVAILAVMMSIGVPSFQSLIAGQRLRSAATHLQSALNLTRSEAIKRNAVVTLSPNSATNWQTGWKIVDSASTILFTRAALPATMTITGPASVQYRGTGRINATADGKFQLSTSATTEIRCVEVDLSGISMITKGVCPS